MGWGDRPVPVYNQDGSTFGHIDEPEGGPGLSGDYRQTEDDGSDDDRVKTSIWDEDQDDNPADGYRYQEPKDVPQNRPQGFWGAGGGGNPAWSTPTPGQRWGDEATGGFDPRTGMPEGPRGSVTHGGPVNDVKRKYRKAAKEVTSKYDNVRHPSRRIKRKISEELHSRMPHSEVKKIMKDRNWL